MLQSITPIPKKIIAGQGRLTLGRLGAPDFRVTAKGLDGELSRNALGELCRGLSLRFGTPAENFTLDVRDLRGIASDIMNTMR